MNRPIDLPRARRALAELDRIAAEHPELCRGGERWADNLDHLETIMGKPNTGGTPARERMVAYRRRLIKEQGRHRVSVFLTPDAHEVLIKLRARHPGMSTNDLVSDVLTGRIRPREEENRQ